ncbi:MAG: DNA repair protein RadC [Pseudomonadota bacterium]
MADTAPPSKPDKPKPHWLGHRDRLRQKLLARGPSALEDYELLETLLFAFLPRRDVKPVAKALLVRFRSLSAILAADPNDVQKIDGMGETAAAYIRATAELHLRAAKEEIAGRPVISSWTALLAYVRSALQHETREQFRVLFLDRKNQLIADEVMSHGTVDQAPVYPREIARRALELAASSLILVHNHPSGDTTPSRADISITREIIDALTPFEISVHDHLIVGTGGVTSFKSAGLI